MTKSDLIDLLCETKKLPKGRAELLVNTIFDSMVKALETGDRIEIRGFGSLEIRSYRAYAGRNPRTGSTVDVKPKRLPFFKVGKELKDRVNAAAQAASDAAQAALPASAPAKRLNGRGHSPAAPAAASTANAASTSASDTDRDSQPMPAPDLLGELPSARP
jgi:integration host factor subunit beta